MMKSNKNRTAMDTALNILSKRQISVSQLTKRLKDIGYEEESITETINKLVEWRYLNDDDYALAYIKGRRDKYSKKRTLLELQKAGLDGEQTSILLEENYTDELEYHNCLLFAQKYWRNEVNKWENKYKNLDKYRHLPAELIVKKKVGDKLLMKGFPLELVKKILTEEFPGNI